MNSTNIFVFVVCGDRVHIDTLNFSLNAIKNFTHNEIIVVTDFSRNNGKIAHENIIDVRTPKEFDHHQASIYLKTSLHRILTEEATYCYLDSDVIALNHGIDRIFSYKNGPVSFASDHSTIDGFSPYAINCSCLESYQKLQQLIKTHDPYFNTANISNPDTRKLFCFLDEIRSNKSSQLLFDARFHLNKLFRKKYHAGRDYYYVFNEKIWISKEGRILLNNILNYKDKIEAEGNFTFIANGQKWVDKNNKIISELKCNHLVDAIKNKFGISISDTQWNHWNGGVFLFDREAHHFMEAWHSKTMDIFKDPSWKTRDQGTLAATAWEHNLQSSQRIPEEFNFIADYYNPFISYAHGKGFTKNNFRSMIHPHFIHIYHNFGNEKWDVWNGVQQILHAGQ